MNCATENLNTYIPTLDLPWNEKRVNHFLRRCSFGGNLEDFFALRQSIDPAQTITDQINNAANITPDPFPFWENYVLNDFDSIEQMQELAQDFITSLIYKMKSQGIREKMILFWMNHFVTQFQIYEFGPFLFKYYHILETYAFGNFKTFVKEIGLSHAMLIFLNGDENTSLNPNENYARELYELFTLGVDNNYTQNDIVETAKAFTGHYINPLNFNVAFYPPNFSNGNKTIFGQTGNFDYNDVINILFEERTEEIANFICAKIYKHFVSVNIVDDIITELATTLIDNNFELLPVYLQLFSSNHFFDGSHLGAIVKSPVDAILTFTNEIEFNLEELIPTNPDFTYGYAIPFLLAYQGQALFNPVDVAGWQGNRNWLNSDSLTQRWSYIDAFTNYCVLYSQEILRDFAIDLSNNSNDPFEITSLICNYFLPNGLQTLQEYDKATNIFKWEVPQNYFDNGSWNLSWIEAPQQIALLIQHIGRLPEFQLF